MKHEVYRTDNTGIYPRHLFKYLWQAKLVLWFLKTFDTGPWAWYLYEGY